MKLNKEEKKLLKEFGYSEEDLLQIQNLKFTFKLYKGAIMGEKITIKRAKKILGTIDFLSGIGRASFHWTAFRSTNDGGIYIQSNLYE